jgi:hypothetical protein
MLFTRTAIRAVMALSACASCAAATYDWRFADPNSVLIAGSSVSPTVSNPAAYFFIQTWTPFSRLPAPFLPLFPRIQTVTYSSVSSRQEITVLSGTFDLAALRSAAGNAGMKSQTYDNVEILASQTTSWDQIALVSSSTIVFGRTGTLRAALDRWAANPGQSATNPIIQQSATFAPGWDLFAIGSGNATVRALLGAKPVAQYLTNKAPVLGAELAASTGFTFRARTQSNIRLELNVTEPDVPTAANVASTLLTVPGQIKAKGTGVADVLSLVATVTTVTQVGSVVELVLDPNLYTLTTAISPSQTGTLTPPTTGVVFAANSVVTLTATPGACYGAPVWSGNAPGGVVIMSGPQTATATFQNVSAAAPALNATATPGALRLNKTTGRYQQVLTLANTGPALTNASVVFDNLPSGVSLFSPDGVASCAPTGGPYRNVASIPVGPSSLTVEFTVTNSAIAIQYSPRILSAGGSR